MNNISKNKFYLSLYIVYCALFIVHCASSALVTREVAASSQAREKAAHVDLFVEQKVKAAPIEIKTKQEILTEFNICSTGLRECANSLEQVSAQLDKAQKDFLKLEVIKNRVVMALVILSVLVILFIVVRVLVAVYLRK